MVRWWLLFLSLSMIPLGIRTQVCQACRTKLGPSCQLPVRIVAARASKSAGTEPRPDARTGCPAPASPQRRIPAPFRWSLWLAARAPMVAGPMETAVHKVADVRPLLGATVTLTTPPAAMGPAPAPNRPYRLSRAVEIRRPMASVGPVAAPRGTAAGNHLTAAFTTPRVSQVSSAAVALLAAGDAT